MAEQYDIKQVESKIMGFWDREKIFKFDLKRGRVFSIDTPPPTVSGKCILDILFLMLKKIL